MWISCLLNTCIGHCTVKHLNDKGNVQVQILGLDQTFLVQVLRGYLIDIYNEMCNASSA